MLTGPSAGDAEQAITNPSHERLTDRNARIDSGFVILEWPCGSAGTQWQSGSTQHFIAESRCGTSHPRPQRTLSSVFTTPGPRWRGGLPPRGCGRLTHGVAPRAKRQYEDVHPRHVLEGTSRQPIGERTRQAGQGAQPRMS